MSDYGQKFHFVIYCIIKSCYLRKLTDSRKKFIDCTSQQYLEAFSDNFHEWNPEKFMESTYNDHEMKNKSDQLSTKPKHRNNVIFT